LSVRGFQGALDDVRIYDKALTASEVIDLINEEGVSNRAINKNISQNLNAEKTLKLYPNPVSKTLNITFKGYEEASYKLYLFDIYGKLIITKVLNTNSGNEIDIDHLSEGVYIATIRKNNIEPLLIKRVIKN
jgi:hypothetical protein